MASKTTKQRPAGVPEENVYNRMHWTIIVALIASAVALYLIVMAG
jgi:hypothetical protein